MKNEQVMIVLISLAAVAVVYGLVRGHFRREFLVNEGFAGLFYHHGQSIEVLSTGRHVRWGRNLTCTPVDLRKTQISIASQELLTSDNVALKLTLVLWCQVLDPAKAIHDTQYWAMDIYTFAQLAVRALVGATPVEELLAKRLELGAQLLARLQPEAAKIGVQVHSADVKDVMFPAELKRAFAEVLKAKQEGQAALERARCESAALRNLANAARLLEGNPALMNLRVLQSLATSQAAGNTLVMGVPGGFVPLPNGPTKASDTPPANA